MWRGRPSVCLHFFSTVHCRCCLLQKVCFRCVKMSQVILTVIFCDWFQIGGGDMNNCFVYIMNRNRTDSFLSLPCVSKGSETCRCLPPSRGNQRETEDLMPQVTTAHPLVRRPLSSSPSRFCFLCRRAGWGESCDHVTWLQAVAVAHAHCASGSIWHPPPSPSYVSKFWWCPSKAICPVIYSL